MSTRKKCYVKGVLGSKVFLYFIFHQPANLHFYLFAKASHRQFSGHPVLTLRSPAFHTHTNMVSHYFVKLKK